MPKVNECRHGTPCWVDLATVDLAGARAFYGGLFGWEYVDEEMEEMDIGIYSMASHVAAVEKSRKKQQSSINPFRQGDFGS